MLYDLTNLKESFNQDEKELEEVVRLFIKYFPIYVHGLEPAYKRKDYELLHYNLHKIKSNLYLFNVEQCRQEVHMMEEMVREEFLPEKENLLKIISVLNRVMEEIKKDYPHLC